MTSNLKALQQALNSNTQPRQAEKPPKARPEPEPKPKAEPVKEAAQGGYMAPSREGKTNITAYLSPDYKAGLRLIQARTGKSLQALIAESLNDLFSKYDVPTVRHD